MLFCAVELDASSTDDDGLEEEALGFGNVFGLGCLEDEAEGTQSLDCCSDFCFAFYEVGNVSIHF